MKRILLAATAVLALASCTKGTDPAVDETTGIPVHLTFGDTDNFSRNFAKPSTDAEPWEKSIQNMVVYAYDSKGRQILRKVFDKNSIADLNIEVKVPTHTAGEMVMFYVLANRDQYHATIGESEFYSNMDSDIMAYNGPYDRVGKEALRTHGFAFSGFASSTMKSGGAVNRVLIRLKRMVAKVAITVDIDPTFTKRYLGGTIKVTSIKLNNIVTSSTWLFNNYNRFSSNTFTSLTQETRSLNGYYHGLFYVFEQNNPDSKIELTINTLFDSDGIELTKEDQIPYSYTVLLNGSGDGEIRRNTLYLINATISDLNAMPIFTPFEVSEWEGPNTFNLGRITVNINV